MVGRATQPSLLAAVVGLMQTPVTILGVTRTHTFLTRAVAVGVVPQTPSILTFLLGVLAEEEEQIRARGLRVKGVPCLPLVAVVVVLAYSIPVPLVVQA